MRQRVPVGISLLSGLGLFAACDGSSSLGRSSFAIDQAPPVVIREVFGGGSNSGAPLTHDYVELFNVSSGPVSLAGWSIQYASATGTGNFGASASQLTELPAVTLESGQSFLVQEAGGSVGAPLPTPDYIDDTPIALSASAGKVALVRSNVTLGCNGGSNPCSSAAADLIVDLLGFGSANYFEGAAAPALSNTTAATRAGAGCNDSNDNSVDFSASAPSPRNSASALTPCSSSGGSGGATGSGGAPGSGGSSGGNVGTGGSSEPGPLRIHDLQGRAHRSPYENTRANNVPGVVTYLSSNGFYLQDPTPDADDATSEAVFVFTSTAPSVALGDSLLVSADVHEFRPGCSNCTPSSSAYANLTTTELDRPQSIIVLSSGNPLPAPVLLSAAGRLPPTSAIDSGAPGDVENASAVFAPESDGIDFYESLEGMRVTLPNPVVVGPSNSFGEIPVLTDSGSGAGLRTARGGIVISASDFNPERMVLDGNSMPSLNVGDAFAGNVTAVVDYTFGNFKFWVTEALPPVTAANLAREVTTLGAPAENQLSVASFNVENLDPNDPPEKFAALAGLIVNNLGAPDLLTLEEVQDNSGPTNDGTVAADVTLQLLVTAISAAGGPSYETRSIAPVDGQDGGEPGGNIRVAFLFRTDRGLAFVDRPGAGSSTPNAVTSLNGVPQLVYSPGRVDPSNAAFANSRKPLSAEFRFNGKALFVVANHFNSKGGDSPLFGRLQPPVLGSEQQRSAQASVLAQFVSQIRAIDPNAAVLLAGDLNDFEFSAPVTLLKGAGLTSLVETLPPNERYTYVYEGNSQVLDHVMASPSLLGALSGFDVVHVNAEFATQSSDHDPAVARFTLGALPTAKLRPLLECVRRNGPLSWTARFGYENPNALPVTRAIGAQNRFIPAPESRGQPSVFAPGRQANVFEVEFRPLSPALWTLDGRIALGTILSPRCP
ncbi:MAG: lamin tail domain-containing protein [Polyangiaceae bacterium]